MFITNRWIIQYLKSFKYMFGLAFLQNQALRKILYLTLKNCHFRVSLSTQMPTKIRRQRRRHRQDARPQRSSPVMTSSKPPTTSTPTGSTCTSATTLEVRVGRVIPAWARVEHFRSLFLNYKWTFILITLRPATDLHGSVTRYDFGTKEMIKYRWTSLPLSVW